MKKFKSNNQYKVNIKLRKLNLKTNNNKKQLLKKLKKRKNR